MTLKPSLYMAFSLSLLALPVQAKPACWQVVPGPTPDPALVAWWHGGKKLLETPAAWDVARAYQELESYGYCSKTGERASSQPATAATEPVREVRSSAEIIKEKLEADKAQRSENSRQNSWPVILFFAGAVAAFIKAAKEDDGDIHKEVETKSRRFFSGVKEPSPWLLDQVPPARVGAPAPSAPVSSEPGAGTTPEPAEPTSSQWFGGKFGKSSDNREPGSEKVRKRFEAVSQDQLRQTFEAEKPYCINDDDYFVMAVIRMGREAGMKKGEIMSAFYYLKPEGADTYVKSPVTKGENTNYERFNELYAEVEHPD